MRKIFHAALIGSLLIPGIAVAQPSGGQPATVETWQQYRETNSEAFRQPAYVPPAGERYRRTSVGKSLSPSFLARPYRIENYGDYRLPPPSDGQKYIRHGNDLLLVIVRAGRVMQVYPDFFL
jgi:Ni/Co efflux regulator RcnB